MKNLATAIATSGHLIEQNKQGLSVEDVFSTYVYDGNSSTQSIVNGIDLSTEGGMVWIKPRNQAWDHSLFDTERGATKYLVSNATQAEATTPTTLTAFNSDGFSLDYHSVVNDSSLSTEYTSWTFRKAPRFFDVVKYTGNGVAGREIAHDLGVAPGMIIVKRLDLTGNWVGYHKSLGATYSTQLNLTDASSGPSAIIWNNTEPTDALFTVGSYQDNNLLNGEYIAYLFADDPDGPSGDGSDGLIACGSYSGSSSDIEIDVGWEPQFVIIKRTDSTSTWITLDSMRGWPTGSGQSKLYPNTSQAEGVGADAINLTATGFVIFGGIDYDYSQSGGTYIYMAIRRPMRTPESSDEVFAIDVRDGAEPDFPSPFPVDMALERKINTTETTSCGSRLTQGKTLYTDSTAAEVTNGSFLFDYMDGWHEGNGSHTAYYSWMWKRATGFFDVVAYEGTGAARTVAHNLGVAPELWIIKARDDATRNWIVGITSLQDGILNVADPFGPGGVFLTVPTATGIDISTSWNLNKSGLNYIMYMFATLAGISKVGSYTGNGTNQTLDCGFAGGAKFVLIKRTDSTGDWYMWDSVRGIVAGNDPHLSLNTTAAEVTTDDSIDPDSTGFIVNQNVATNINVNAGEYIYYAIA